MPAQKAGKLNVDGEKEGVTGEEMQLSPWRASNGGLPISEQKAKDK